jgi:hypothetical protein
VLLRRARLTAPLALALALALAPALPFAARFLDPLGVMGAASSSSRGLWVVAAGAAALERGLRLRGAGLGLDAAAAAAVVVVVPLVGEVEFEDFGARFLTLSMRWRIALGVQSG